MYGDEKMDTVSLSIADGVAHVELNRPERGNALDLSMSRQLARAFQEVRRVQRSVRAVVFRGAGKRFCVGGDLNGFLQSGPDDRLCDVLARPLHDVVETMAELEVPVVCLVHGAVGGGGLGIMLASDIVLAADDTVFRCGYTGSGLSPDCGVTWHLPRVMGMARAMDLVLTNRRLTATEAERAGLISRVVPSQELASACDGVVGQLALVPRQTLAETKRLMWSGWEAHRHSQLHDEATTIGRIGDSVDSREAIEAFLTKRQPRFSDQGGTTVTHAADSPETARSPR